MKKPLSKRWKKAGIILVAFVLFLVAAYQFLLSEYSLKNLWLPLAADAAGVRLKVASCSASLLGERTFSARGLTVETPEASASFGSVELRAHPVAFLFEKVFRIDSLSLTGAEVALRRDGTKSAGSGTARPNRKKTSSGKTETDDPVLPVRIGRFSIAGLHLKWEDAAGAGKFELAGANVSIDDFAPGELALVRTDGIITAAFQDISVTETRVTSNLKFSVPEKGFIPRSFSVNINSGKASVRAGGLSSGDAALAFIAEFELGADSVTVKSGSLSIGNDSGGDILAVNLSGTVRNDFSTGRVDGSVRAFPSALTDAVLSRIAKADISGFSAMCGFRAELLGGELSSKADLQFDADRIVIRGLSAAQTVENLGISAGISLAGNPMKRNFRLNSARLEIRQRDHVLTEAVLNQPWDFMRNGELVFQPFPRALVRAEKFPLRLLLPFGLNPEYEKENVSFELSTSPAKDGASELSASASTSFPVAGVGPLKASLKAAAEKNGVCTIRECTVVCESQNAGVTVRLAGNWVPRQGTFAADSSILLRNPALLLNRPEWKAYPEVSSTVTVGGTVDPTTREVRFWTGVTGGKYHLDLSADVTPPYGENTLLSVKKGRVSLRAGDTEMLILAFHASIPSDGIDERFECAVQTEQVRSGILTELPFEIPGNFDFSKWKASFKADASGARDGSLNARGELSVSGIVIPDWDENAQSAVWDNQLSFSCGLEKEVLHLRKGRIVSSIGGTRALDLDLTGVWPLHPAKGSAPKFALRGENIDALAGQKLAARLRRSSGENASQAEPARTASSSSSGDTAMKPFAEPPALNLSQFDGAALSMDLRRITYTDDLIADCKAALTLRNNEFRLAGTYLTVNRIPGTLNLALDTGSADGWPFSVSANFSNLPLAPVMRAAAHGTDPGVTGTLKLFDLNLSGRGFTAENLRKNTSGAIRGSITKLSVPVKAAADDAIVRMILLPLESVPDLLPYTGNFSSTEIGKKLSNIAKRVSPVLSGEKNLTFASASGRILISDGVLALRNIKLLDGTVDAEELNGTLVLPDGKLSVDSKMTVEDLILPVRVGGTLRKPEIDAAGTVKALLRDNAENMLKPENIEKTVRQVNEVIQLFR